MILSYWNLSTVTLVPNGRSIIMNRGIGIIGTIIVVLLILWLVGVL